MTANKLRLTMFSKAIERAERNGWIVTFDEDCGTSRVGIVTFARGAEVFRAGAKATLADGYEGLNFVPIAAGVRSLAELVEAIQ